MNKRLDLTDVTLCAADSAFVEWTLRSFRRCMAQCDFGDVILFSHETSPGPGRTVLIPELKSIEDYSRFCLLEMGKHIQTPFCLVVQWDSFVIDTTAWQRTFRRCDYIGAAWHGQFPGPLQVGNGGFSWRSRKLLQALVQLQPAGAYFFEDRVISHLYRDVLEKQFGVRFATVEAADRFSYEFHQPTAPTFGFHGLQHIWAHIDEAEMLELAAAIDFKKMSAEKILRLVSHALDGGRRKVAAAVYAQVRAAYPSARVRLALKGWFMEERAVDEALARMEALLG